MKNLKNNKWAVILCGGTGERMGSLVKKTPKPLLKIDKKPIIWYVCSKLIDSGFTDCWRYLNPDLKFNGYTWWNLRVPTYRLLDMGWRIDYIITNETFNDSLRECRVLKKVGSKTKECEKIGKYGSDHCPIFAIFEF